MTIRSTLTTLVLFLGGALLVAVALLVEHAWREARAAEAYAASDTVRAGFLAAGADLVRERARTYVALRSAGAVTAEAGRELGALRRRSDQRLTEALAGLDRANLATLLSASTRDKVSSAWKTLRGLRGRVDAALKQPLQARLPELAEEWFSAATILITNSQSLRLDLARALPMADKELAEHSALKHFAWITSEQAGRVVALVAGALAQERAPFDHEFATIAMADAQTELAWELVRDIAGDRTTGSVAAAVTRADNAYFGRLMGLRERIYRAARRREPIPVSLTEWTNRADAAMSVLMRVQAASVAETAAHVSRLKARAERHYLIWSLIGALGVAAVALSLLILHHRVLRPLRSLTGTMARLAEGDLSTPVPRPTRRDELGAVVQALRASKARALQAARLRAAKHQVERQASQAIEDREARLRAIVDGVAEGILMVDTQGRVESANPAALRLFGHPPGAMVGRSVAELVPESERQRFADDVRLYAETATSPLLGSPQEVAGLRADGSLVPLEVTVTETELARQRILTATVRDIAARKAVDRMKTEFISTVSHELRTPLTSIRGSLALLLGPFGTGLSGEARPLVEMAHRNAERLIMLVNDILDIERIEGRRLEFAFRPLDLVALVREAIDANQSFAAERGVAIRLGSAPDSLEVSADAGRLLQVMANLLSNAAKFSGAGAGVVVEVNRERDAARVTVRDAGPGVPEEFRARIFQKFAQADSADTRRQGGTGLGLSISKAIVERHGGRIGYRSRPGDTSFFFTLPLATETNSAGHEAPAGMGVERDGP